MQNEIKTQDVVDACYCSKSVLEKIFQCVSRLSVHEYIIKRRMTIAARMLVSDKDINVLDAALACGYSTNESFTRAFKGVWNCNPSDFRARKDIFELFPRLYPPIMNRMERGAGDDDIVFRIGGDEFVMLTNHAEKEYADSICEKIKAYNGQPISCEGQDIPLHLHVGVVKFNGSVLKYRDLYDQLHFAILDSKY